MHAVTGQFTTFTRETKPSTGCRSVSLLVVGLPLPAPTKDTTTRVEQLPSLA